MISVIMTGQLSVMISVGNTGWNEAYQASHETLLEVLHKMM